jgi:hypothetical protein
VGFDEEEEARAHRLWLGRTWSGCARHASELAIVRPNSNRLPNQKPRWPTFFFCAVRTIFDGGQQTVYDLEIALKGLARNANRKLQGFAIVPARSH